MPKVYLSKSDRQRTRLTASIHVQMKQQGVTTTDLGRAWNMTQQAAAYRIREGNITLMDLWKMQDLIEFTGKELLLLIRNDNSTKKAATPHHREQAAFNRNR